MVLSVACYKCKRTCNNILIYTPEDVKRYCVNENINDNFYFGGYVVFPHTNKRIYVKDPMIEMQKRLNTKTTTITNKRIYG